MKDFFIQCLKDLEPLTGLRQLFFLQSDMEDGERKKDVLIAGMIATCKQFDYIPEKAQQKIIREMMVKDQDYDSLNSRVIYKWLNMHKDIYFTKSNTPEITPIRDLSEEEKKRIDELAENFKRSLMTDFRPQFQGIEQDIENIKKEDKEKQQGQKASGYIPDEKNVLLNKKKLEAARARGLDKLELNQIFAFEIFGEIINARNIDEAREIYLEVYE